MMPGFLGGNKAAAGGVPPGMNLKNALIQAAPLFASMAAGYSSGRGPYAYMDQGIASIQANQKAKRDEEAAAAAAAAFGNLRPGGMGAAGSGGGLPISTAPRNPNDPTSISGDTMAALGKDSGTAGYRASLIGTESGGNWKAQNSEIGAGGKAGHFGRVQFGQARLQEAMNAGAIPQGTTPEQFMNSPALQIAAENWHFADLESQLGDLVGREVNGKVMDLPALVAMGHLGGAGGARKYVESGGAYNPSDSFGTSLADYATTHGGSGAAPAATVADPMSDPYVQQLMTVMAMSGLTPEQRSVVELQLQGRMAALAPKEAPKPIEVGGVLLDPVTMKPIFDSREPPAPPKPYSSMGEIQMDLANGIITPEQAQFATDNLGKGGVTVNTGDGTPPADDKLRGKLMEKEGELWAGYLQTGATSAGTAQDMAAIDELIKIAPQGPVSGRLAEVFPGFSTAGDAFQSIVKRVAPTLRAPGSGATSDIEYDGMLKSLPALRNTPEANAAIAAMMKAKAALNVERSNIVAAYQNGEMDATAARKAMAELDKRSILTPEAAAALGVTIPTDGAAPASGAGTVIDGYTIEAMP